MCLNSCEKKLLKWKFFLFQAVGIAVRMDHVIRMKFNVIVLEIVTEVKMKPTVVSHNSSHVLNWLQCNNFTQYQSIFLLTKCKKLKQYHISVSNSINIFYKNEFFSSYSKHVMINFPVLTVLVLNSIKFVIVSIIVRKMKMNNRRTVSNWE